MEKKLTEEMVISLNIHLNQMGSNLQYIKNSYSDDEIYTGYELKMIDKYLDNSYSQSLSLTKDFQPMIREFLKENFDVSDTGYSNSVTVLICWNNK